MKKLEKHTGFKVPEKYLEGFTSKLMDKLPKESSIPKKEGFSVPEDYFEEVPQRITQKLDKKEDEIKVMRLPVQNTVYYAIAGIAAVILMIFGIVHFQSEMITFDDLATSDIENYFDLNDVELSSYEIAEAIPESDLENLIITETGINDEDIIEYLDTNTVDFEELNLLDNEQ